MADESNSRQKIMIGIAIAAFAAAGFFLWRNLKEDDAVVASKKLYIICAKTGKTYH